MSYNAVTIGPPTATDRMGMIVREQHELLNQIVEARLQGNRNDDAINRLGNLSREKVQLKKPTVVPST